MSRCISFLSAFITFSFLLWESILLTSDKDEKVNGLFFGRESLNLTVRFVLGMSLFSMKVFICLRPLDSACERSVSMSFVARSLVARLCKSFGNSLEKRLNDF